MSRILCWFGQHHWSGWRLAYNVRTGNLRSYQECVRNCGTEKKDE